MGFFLTLRARARTLGGTIPIFLIVVRDNDRAPYPAESGKLDFIFPSPLSLTNRLLQFRACREEILRADKKGEIFPCAIGVSVQMIESWILLAYDPNLGEADLPVFAEKYSATAKNHYLRLGHSPIPPQLKDRYDKVSKGARRAQRRAFNRLVATNADLTSLCQRSPSFADFHAELIQLPSPPRD